MLHHKNKPTKSTRLLFERDEQKILHIEHRYEACSSLFSKLINS